LTTYETPRMGGFMLGAAVSCGNAAADGGATDGGANQKPRVWSVAGTYVGGPLSVGLAYEKHKDVGLFNVPGPDLEDTGWGASVAYTWGPLKTGVTYMNREYETLTGDLDHDTWTFGAEWQIAGPHELHFSYGDTGNTSGSSLTGVALTANGGAPAPGSSTGYKAWTIGYQYAFSKRTTAKIGYIRVENDSNSSQMRANNTAPLIGNGQNVDNWALVVRHAF
jgi:predicted porin